MLGLEWKPIPATDRVIAVPLRMVHNHWYRANAADQPCTFNDCGRRGDEHLRWCGEWMLPRRRRWRVMAGRIRRNLGRA